MVNILLCLILFSFKIKIERKQVHPIYASTGIFKNRWYIQCIVYKNRKEQKCPHAEDFTWKIKGKRFILRLFSFNAEMSTPTL